MDRSVFKKLAKTGFGKCGIVAAVVAAFFALLGLWFIAVCFILVAFLLYTMNIRSVVDPAKVWSRWDVCAGDEPQIKRMKRAASGEGMAVKRFNEKQRTMVMVGSTGKTYTVSLTSCTCPDFKERGLPCKHIYFLAHKLGLQELPEPYFEFDE